jgi:hypothetical protein
LPLRVLPVYSQWKDMVEHWSTVLSSI